MTTSIILLVICFLFSFFFSGAETALTASSDALMHNLSKDGDKTAEKVLNIKKNPEKLLGTLLLGNNIVNIAASAIATALCITFWGPKWGVFIATFVVSFIVLIFCEIFPKTYAIRNSNKITLKIAPIISFLILILSPIILFLNLIVKTSMKYMGLLKTDAMDEDVKSEIRGTLDLMNDEEIKSEKHMIKSVLDLSELTVQDVMIHRSKMFTLDVDTPLDELSKKIIKSPYTRIPMWKGKPEQIIGLLYTKPFLVARLKNKTSIDIQKYLIEPWFVLETTDLLSQLQAFRERHEHFAFVVDEYGILQGSLTLEDILEEIVGDIVDETDKIEVAKLHIQKNKSGAFVVKGNTPIRDLNRTFGWELDDTDATTIAGLLLYKTEQIPKKNSVYTFDGFRFKILEKKHNQILSVSIHKIGQDK